MSGIHLMVSAQALRTSFKVNLSGFPEEERPAGALFMARGRDEEVASQFPSEGKVGIVLTQEALSYDGAYSKLGQSAQ